MNFAQNLKRAREAANLTGKQLAEELSIPYPTYMAYENQGREPKYHNLIKIAERLDVSLDELLDVKLPSKINNSWEKAKRELINAFTEWDIDINLTDLKNDKVKIDITSSDNSVYDFIISKLEIIDIVEKTIKVINNEYNDKKIDCLYDNFLNCFAHYYFKNLTSGEVMVNENTKYIEFINKVFKQKADNNKLNIEDIEEFELDIFIKEDKEEPKKA